MSSGVSSGEYGNLSSAHRLRGLSPGPGMVLGISLTPFGRRDKSLLSSSSSALWFLNFEKLSVICLQVESNWKAYVLLSYFVSLLNLLDVFLDNLFPELVNNSFN